MRGFATLLHVIAATLSTAVVAVPLEAEPGVNFASQRAVRKDPAVEVSDKAAEQSPSLFATLVQVHTGEHVALGDDGPTRARFDQLLADRTTGELRVLDPRLLDLLRGLAQQMPGARIELVSGFRSPKLNERLRKKGHNVASHSQHSLGQAVDFRIVPEGDVEPIDPLAIEKLVRDLGWEGGVGVYPIKSDRFVHADVGPMRRWLGK